MSFLISGIHAFAYNTTTFNKKFRKICFTKILHFFIKSTFAF